MIWLFLGLALGWAIGVNHSSKKMPEQLNACVAERDTAKEDLDYYRKLCKTLADENRDLREKLFRTVKD